MNDGPKDVTQRLEVSIFWTPLATLSLGQSWIRSGDGKQFPLYFRQNSGTSLVPAIRFGPLESAT